MSNRTETMEADGVTDTGVMISIEGATKVFGEDVVAFDEFDLDVHERRRSASSDRPGAARPPSCAASTG